MLEFVLAERVENLTAFIAKKVKRAAAENKKREEYSSFTGRR